MEENNQSVKINDEIIRQKVMDGLHRDPGIDTTKIEVQVKNGEVVLKGRTDTENEKMLSEKIARSVEGVSKVENHLHIGLGLVHALTSIAAHIQGDIIKNDDDDDDDDEKKS
ncbi:MAG TPA: BON domain-containing protein [Chitinophagaceae bacterium]|nr:BON domain-containing protein [Chitinophagaceae bacterium]